MRRLSAPALCLVAMAWAAPGAAQATAPLIAAPNETIGAVQPDAALPVVSDSPTDEVATGSTWSPFDPPLVTAEEASAPLSVLAGEAYGWPIVTYWVNPGDTLYHIAQAHLTSVGYLRRLNPEVIASHLMVGQTLLVPSEAPVHPVQTYRVQAGDTLWHIAELYNTDVASLETLNGITDPDKLHLGSLLIIRD